MQIFYRSNTYVKIIVEETIIYYNDTSSLQINSENRAALSRSSRVVSGTNLDQLDGGVMASNSVNEFSHDKLSASYMPPRSPQTSNAVSQQNTRQQKDS